MFNGSQYIPTNFRLNSLVDTSIISPLNTQILQYNGSTWNNVNANSLPYLRLDGSSAMSGNINFNNNNAVNLSQIIGSGTVYIYDSSMTGYLSISAGSIELGGVNFSANSNDIISVGVLSGASSLTLADQT